MSNKTAYKTELSSHKAPIEDVLRWSKPISPKTGKEQTIQVVGSRSHMSQETLDYVEGIKKQGKQVEIVSKGSSLKFCLVAEGKADVYPRFAPTMEWDTAAGQAICKAAGLKVISRKTNNELEYNKENLLNPHFIVSA